MITANIAFAGLTAAGKTTHAKLLAEELGYNYVSATEIMLGILQMPNPGELLWFTHLDTILEARKGDLVDIELERRLEVLAHSTERTVFDSWALAWITTAPMVRVWIESDLPSRTRKCLVSLRENSRTLNECEELVQAKDESTRAIFLRRHGFDLFHDRSRYGAVLCNSHLIPEATADASQRGIELFAPVVRDTVLALMADDSRGLAELRAANSREVLCAGSMHGRAV